MLEHLFLNQNTSQLAAGMNGSQKNLPEGILRSLLRSSSLMGLLVIQSIGIQQECIRHNEDDGHHVRVTVSGQALPSMSPQWLNLREINTEVVAYVGDIERDNLRFNHIIDGQTRGSRIILVEGTDYIVELVRGGETESGDMVASRPFTTRTCD